MTLILFQVMKSLTILHQSTYQLKKRYIIKQANKQTNKQTSSLKKLTSIELLNVLFSALKCMGTGRHAGPREKMGGQEVEGERVGSRTSKKKLRKISQILSYIFTIEMIQRREPLQKGVGSGS